MKNIIAMALPLTLLSCGGGGGGSSDQVKINPAVIECATNNSGSTASTNSIQITVNNKATNTPMQGIVVQVDHKGKCIFTDVDGKANFDNLTAGAHDIHVFGQKGFGWKSFYDLKVSDTAVLILPVIEISNPADPTITVSQPFDVKSVLVYGGSVEFNSPLISTDPENIISFEYFANQNFKVIKEQVSNVGTNYILEYAFDKTSDIAVIDEFLTFKTSVNGTSKDQRLIDGIRLTPNASTRTNSTTVKLVNPLNISFSIAPRILTNILRFKQVGFPNGLSLSSLRLMGQFQTNNNATNNNRVLRTVQFFNTTQNANFDITQSIFAYSPPVVNFNSVRVYLTANNASGSNWAYNTTILYSSALGSTLSAQSGFTLIPKLTTIPTLEEPIADTIKWSNPTNVILQQSRIQILRGTDATEKRWNIEVTGATNRIMLPSLPVGIVPLLKKSEAYSLSLSGDYQYTSTIGIGNAIESYTSQLTWNYYLLPL